MTDSIREATRTLVDPGTSPVDLREAGIRLAELCAVASETKIPASPLTGRPMVDVWRLAAWIRGAHAALDACETEGPPSVLGIGLSGEVAAGIASHGSVRLTLLDSMPRRLKRASLCVAHVAGEAPPVHVADPTAFTPDHAFDIAISSHVTSALEDCLGPAITAQLSTHATRWLPSRVDIEAVLVDHQERTRQGFGVAASLQPDGLHTPALDVPPLEAWGDVVLLATRVEVYADHGLEPFQSGITMDRPLPDGPVLLPSSRLLLHWDEAERRLGRQ